MAKTKVNDKGITVTLTPKWSRQSIEPEDLIKRQEVKDQIKKLRSLKLGVNGNDGMTSK